MPSSNGSAREAPVIVLGTSDDAPDDERARVPPRLRRLRAAPLRPGGAERAHSRRRPSGAPAGAAGSPGRHAGDRHGRAARHGPGRAGQALPEGVRARHPPRRRPRPRLHPGRAPAGDLELARGDADADARLARLTASPQAPRARPRDALRRQRVGRRLPARRRLPRPSRRGRAALAAQSGSVAPSSSSRRRLLSRPPP